MENFQKCVVVALREGDIEKYPALFNSYFLSLYLRNSGFAISIIPR